MIKGYNENLAGLEQDIIHKIHKLERNRLFFKQGVYELVSIVSFASIIPAVIYIINSLSTSGFYDYVSLIFSDIEALSYWKELSLSMLESLPFLGLAIGLGVIGIFLWSIMKSLKIQVLKNSIA